ncbi:fungal-specific transcription factor domain-containing protein [Annulohypoxylon maeteangense]|uniref:fungal-specific transcription factor domain-containing protein n=1 Tax=Annulohypoxylon maeteangense TaxID=1927788 RepID=UPI0020086E04|nr:fungal-specific transcription factor domain-containing protein [Annulohypoxylon maeteangense]KAI0888504.1 fungal-specific transcription factor domain-containing protein [Annulohypoxylon maeteangense]
MPDQDGRIPYSGSGTTPRGRARLPLSRRRDKPQLSCNLCRKRKLKCDREHPCSACTRRGLGSSCTYVTNLPSHDGSNQSTKAPLSVQDRIQQLESLVVDLMKTSGINTTPESPSSMSSTDSIFTPASTKQILKDASPASDCGSMRLSEASVSYVSSAHWAAILEGIGELKDHLEEEESQNTHQVTETPEFDITGPQLLYGCSRHANKEELLASVPPRQVADRLVSHYFNSFEMSPAILHSHQFLKEYEQFWESPSTTSFIWLGLLFAIMSLSAQFQVSRIDPGEQFRPSTPPQTDLQAMMEMFRHNTVQCLILGRYTRGGTYVIETMILYFMKEYILCKDADIGVWILLSTIVQIAMHMGYHRDPKHFEGMSAFAGEMRRRVWTTLVEFDLAISAQMGLPRLVKEGQADTEEPRNLHDSDFDADTVELPPARPGTELTIMLYRLSKSRMMSSLGLIWDLAADIRPHTYAEVMSIDAKLEEAHASIPDCLKWLSMAQCIADSPKMIMQKVFLRIIFYRAKIVLHRQFSHTRTPHQFNYSREAILDASFKLLEYQRMFDEETQPFCRLYEERWRVSSLVSHDFLLAISILCLYLQKTPGEIRKAAESALIEKILKYLEASYNIWLRHSSTSKDAQKAAKALNIVIQNRRAPNKAPNLEPTTSEDWMGWLDGSARSFSLSESWNNMDFQTSDANFNTLSPTQWSFGL